MTALTKLLVPFAALAMLAACPGGKPEDESKTGPKQVTATVAPPSAHPAAAEGAPIEVDLLEYQIRMPDTVAAGHQVFSIINHGKENHSFRIKGDGIDVGLTEPLARGDTGQITISLAPGTYTISCPVDGHAGKGMTRTLTVK